MAAKIYSSRNNLDYVKIQLGKLLPIGSKTQILRTESRVVSNYAKLLVGKKWSDTPFMQRGIVY